MTDLAPLDLEVLAQTDGAPLGRGANRRIVALVLLILLIAAAGLAMFNGMPGAFRHARGTLPLASANGHPLPFDPEKLQVSDPTALEALTPDQAMAENAARPDSALPVPTAQPLIVPQNDMQSFQRSLDCMTAAIYYEAAFEPVDGQRAVAQVVLNRLRHPLYPHTVCGVVFQGSERSTGCQFTFTCDGALARIPSRALWSQARDVAKAALDGYVYRPVGLATHYHANYVVPYWASSLVKVSTIGRHIFYRIDGSYGSPPAFRRLYAGNEPRVFERNSFGQLVVLNQPQQLAPGEISAPDIRPLSVTGAIMAGDAGASAPNTQAAPAATRRANATKVDLRADYAARPTSKARSAVPAMGQRWVIGMDGANHQGAETAPQSEAAGKASAP